MIPRFQRFLFAAMLLAAVVMAVVLIRMRERAHDRLMTAVDSQPLNELSSASSSAPVEKITLLVANDLDGSLIPVERSFPMPKDPNARARVLMEKLLEEYAAPKSTHPIANASGVDEVFLMPLPQQKGASQQGEMAVVNLDAAFVQAQPSGIEPETLTLLSMIATLHANLPQITEVRFLVDGQQKDTLAGHADLTRVYLASDTQTAVRP
ncbi:GerMN domain-containing protein [Alloacidobacterium dinghuense]|uniref:GerMN domain-containing protein n=1 Tax=Alloacidobacterium dinghuense TaxID=2763107 RepID=A0A7G8BIC2_9BACT|nr:GerMN domain-containing protein [Alloacidobacterium dinghuense]QNI32292.1 GerMN domain-containing protein [Alloacidobacterium dinghuense]